MRSRSLWCRVLVERLVLLPVKMTLSGKGLSPRVMESRQSMNDHNRERVNASEEVEIESVVE